MQVPALALAVKVLVFGSAVLALVATGHPRLAVDAGRGRAAELGALDPADGVAVSAPAAGLTCCSRPHTNVARTPPGRRTSQRVTHARVHAHRARQADDVVEHVLPDPQLARPWPAGPASPGARTRCSFSTVPPGPLSTSQ